MGIEIIEGYKEKVTSYEISQRLAELGFKCESHTGWWSSYNTWTGEFNSAKYQATEQEMLDSEADDDIKAYSCWDLLMWLHKNIENPDYYLDLRITCGGFWNMDENTYYENDSQEPQNALGMLCIKILKKNK